MKVTRFHAVFGQVEFDVDPSLDAPTQNMFIQQQIASLQAAHNALARLGFASQKGKNEQGSKIELDFSGTSPKIILKPMKFAAFEGGKATNKLDVNKTREFVAKVFGSVPNTYNRDNWANEAELTPENARIILDNIMELRRTNPMTGNWDIWQLMDYLHSPATPAPTPSGNPTPKAVPTTNNPLSQQNGTSRRLPAAAPPNPPAGKFDFQQFLEDTKIMDLTLLTYDEVGRLVDPLIGQDVELLLDACKVYAKSVPPHGETMQYALDNPNFKHINTEDLEWMVAAIPLDKSRWGQRSALIKAVQEHGNGA